MIVSCRSKETERILKRLPSRKYQAVQDRVEERLAQLDASTELKDLSMPSIRLYCPLRSPPSFSSHSKQILYWSLTRMRDGNAYQVEIVDYH